MCPENTITEFLNVAVVVQCVQILKVHNLDNHPKLRYSRLGLSERKSSISGDTTRLTSWNWCTWNTMHTWILLGFESANSSTLILNLMDKVVFFFNFNMDKIVFLKFLGSNGNIMHFDLEQKAEQ